MKKLLLFIFLPVIWGMGGGLPEINWRAETNHACFTECVKNKYSCFKSCDMIAFFQTNPADTQECYNRCKEEYYFSNTICEYQSQENNQ